MKKFSYLVCTLFAFLLTFNTAEAQLFEDFESGQKTFYAGATVTLTTGDWYLDDALLGNLSNDKYNGGQGVRMDRRNGRTGNIYMEFDHPNGANELSFYLANYGSSSGNTLQVQYSTDGGNSWTNLGDEIEAGATLSQETLPVEIEGSIRFKFIHASGDDRLNIDDIRITEYITPEENATIDVFADGQEVSNEGTITFASTSSNNQREKVVTIKNRGEELLEIASVATEGDAYSVTDLADSTLAFNESTDLIITFAPNSAGEFQGVLEIVSNAVNADTFLVNISGEGFEDGDVISIADARQLPYETRVTVGGRVTVANEFDGPVFIQDNTAAIAVYWPALHTAVERGDSVVVTGPLWYFKPITAGTPEDFLMQIAATNNDNDITFEVIDTEPVEVTPAVITLQQMNSGEYESQLVLIENVNIDHTGSFQGESNYDISDISDTGLIRIDGDVNIVGATAPTEAVNIVGVVDKFFGDYQLKPRSVDDLGVEEVTYPGDDISKDETFEVATWNIEWFGSTGGGSEDLETQFNNVITVVKEVDADLYAFQEISNTARFADLVDSLEGYGGVIASFSQTQKTAYLFKRATIDSLDSGLITDNMTQSNWANGRFPLLFHFNATIGGETREIFSYNIHAKAFDDAGSYSQRLNASQEMKLYLDNVHRGENMLFIGDYNDTITGSIRAGEESPYKNFDDDSEYIIITKNLEEKGLASQSVGSFIDHITVNSTFYDDYFEGTERVENTNYIGSYLSSTSDHYPIWTRFQFEPLVSNEEEIGNKPLAFSLNQNYPNPFNPTTVISYQLAENSTITLRVFDMLGREVATLVNGERMTAGSHEINFDASNLSSGMYIYQLRAGNGKQLTRKMMLIK